MFIVGQTYENRRGRYTVLAIRGNILDVRYEDGTSVSLDAEMQKRIISNMSTERDFRTDMIRDTLLRKGTPTRLTIDWTQYDMWNRLLFDRYFNADAANRLVYIDVDEEELGRLTSDDQVSPYPSKDFVTAVKGTLDLRRGHLLDSHLQRLQGWRAGGAYPPPPFIAVLAFFCLVAQCMKTDEMFRSNNYYDRLAERLLGNDYEKQKREDIRIGFERAHELWKWLEAWLISQGGRCGLPSARPMYGLAHVGYPISQALLRAHDRQKLPEFFAGAELQPAQEIPAPDLERLMTHWVPNSSLSQAAKTSWNNSAARRRMAEAAGLELSTWDGTLPVHETWQQPAPTIPIAIESKVCTGPRPRLLWGVVFRMSPELPEAIYEVTEDGHGIPMGGKYVESIKVAHGLGERWSEPISGVSIADFLMTKIAMIAKGTKSKALWQPRKVLVLTWDDELKLYRSQQHLEFGRRSMVLVYKAIATKVSEALSSVDAGSMRHIPESWGVPQDWVVYEDIHLTRIPDTGEDADLDALIPEIWTSIEWNGGLALPGRKQWLASRLPTVRVNSIEEVQRLAVGLQRKSVLSRSDNIFDLPPFESMGNTLDIDLAIFGLADGVYGLNVTAYRSEHSKVGEDLARLTFEVRSPDWPLNAGPDSLSYRSDQPFWTLSASPSNTGTPEERTVVITGALVHPERELHNIGLEPPAGLSSLERANHEDVIGPGQGMQRTIGRIADCFSGAHYWILEPVNNMAGFYRTTSGVCKYCGLRKKFYPFGWRKVLSLQSSRPRQEPLKDRTIADTTIPTVTTTDGHDFDYDGLLEACSTLGGGSWSHFELLARQGSDDPVFYYEAHQLFSALGHIDIELDSTGTRPKQWKIAPPAVVATGFGRAVLAGYRSPRLLQVIEEAVKIMGGSFIPVANKHGPTAYFITKVSKESLFEIIRTVNASVKTQLTIAVRPDQSIAAQLAHLRLFLTTARTISQPLTAEVFDVGKASWTANTLAQSDGLYRTDSMPRLYLLRLLGTWYQVSYRTGKHLAAALDGKSLLAYNTQHQELECPLGAQLPGLYERAVVLSSGLPPSVDLDKGKVIYSQVPREVASAVWTAVYAGGQNYS